MTRFLAEHGVESRFVNGLRVTTPEVLDAVLKVLAGSVNQELVAAFVACGAPRSGSDWHGCLADGSAADERGAGRGGQAGRSDARLLNLLMDNGYLPVVACVAGDRQGQFLQRQRRPDGGFGSCGHSSRQTFLS